MVGPPVALTSVWTATVQFSPGQLDQHPDFDASRLGVEGGNDVGQLAASSLFLRVWGWLPSFFSL